MKILLLIVILCTAFLNGCGRSSANAPYPDYYKTYPSPSFVD